MMDTSPALPPVRFNHLYLVLDDKTYRAIYGSEYLRIAFPGVERRSTRTAAGETWSGTYFYCRETYIEFFGSGSSPVAGIPVHGGHWQAGAQEGWGGLAFSVDQPGGNRRVRQALHAAFGYEPFSELRQLRAGEKTVNWFYNLKLAEPLGLGSFDSWVMEYHPEIFAHKGLAQPEDGRLTTLDYLSPWNKERNPPALEAATQGSLALHGRTHAMKSKEAMAGKQLPVPPPVFSAVTGATLHLDPRRAGLFADILSLLGYSRSEDGDDLVLTAHGFSLRICPETASPNGYRFSSLRLAMSRPSVAPITFVFAARSRLVLREDGSAEWFFGE